MKIIETFFVVEISRPFGNIEKTVKKAHLLEDGNTVVIESENKQTSYTVLTRQELNVIHENGTGFSEDITMMLSETQSHRKPYGA
jgi:hypothetical protein